MSTTTTTDLQATLLRQFQASTVRPGFTDALAWLAHLREVSGTLSEIGVWVMQDHGTLRLAKSGASLPVTFTRWDHDTHRMRTYRWSGPLPWEAWARCFRPGRAYGSRRLALNLATGHVTLYMGGRVLQTAELGAWIPHVQGTLPRLDEVTR